MYRLSSLQIPEDVSIGRPEQSNDGGIRRIYLRAGTDSALSRIVSGNIRRIVSMPDHSLLLVLTEDDPNIQCEKLKQMATMNELSFEIIFGVEPWASEVDQLVFVHVTDNTTLVNSSDPSQILHWGEAFIDALLSTQSAVDCFVKAYVIDYPIGDTASHDEEQVVNRKFRLEASLIRIGQDDDTADNINPRNIDIGFAIGGDSLTHALGALSYPTITPL
ncbi:hypothetical protein C8R43DRAFT_1024671 [Mycena crocata]|nr:hypothetical protein C8R43DRAFT_1024671 [Mycena crocata]